MQDPTSFLDPTSFPWAVRELGMSQTQLSVRLEMTQPGVAAAVARGERLVKERGYILLADTGQT